MWVKYSIYLPCLLSSTGWKSNVSSLLDLDLHGILQQPEINISISYNQGPCDNVRILYREKVSSEPSQHFFLQASQQVDEYIYIMQVFQHLYILSEILFPLK